MAEKIRNERFLSLATVIILLLTLILPPIIAPGLAYADHQPNYSFSGGRGTPENPYLLSSKSDLDNLAAAVTQDHSYRGLSYKLTANIDLGDQAWIFGNSGHADFSGIFDGNYKTITLRKLADNKEMGFFGRLMQESQVRNLTIKADINQSITGTDEINFGLLAGSAEGRIENCMTEGRIQLAITGGKRLQLGGLVGQLFEGHLESALNQASLTVKATEGEELSMGGVVGLATGQNGLIKEVTNKGDINLTREGFVTAGGVAGFMGFGSNAENILNSGNINIKITKAPDGRSIPVGGLIGELLEGNLDKGLNIGNIYSEYEGSAPRDGLVVCGIAGWSDRAGIKNAGTEGSLEGKSNYAAAVHGITRVNSSVTLNNAYVKGKVHASVSDRRGDVYAMGLGEILPTNNSYVGASITLKAGSLGTINADAFANIRPGDTSDIFRYSYWNSKMNPFEGYPSLRKAHATSKAVAISTGLLSGSVNIGGKSYNQLSDALNAWVANQGGDYLSWTGGALPTFDWDFGYTLPPALKYKNFREGKWLNTADWALEYMERADRLAIIPASLLNKNMTLEINRLEFAALALELYEHLAGRRYAAKGTSPFKDTDDPVAVKAYELGIITGKKSDEFGPKDVLTREQAATMLTRVYKAVYWEDWTIEADPTYGKQSLGAAGTVEFADHAQISTYAKDSVYFMVKEKIIDGVGDNRFNPQGNATREQAFKIATAMIEANQ